MTDEHAQKVATAKRLGTNAGKKGASPDENPYTAQDDPELHRAWEERRAAAVEASGGAEGSAGADGDAAAEEPEGEPGLVGPGDGKEADSVVLLEVKPGMTLMWPFDPQQPRLLEGGIVRSDDPLLDTTRWRVFGKEGELLTTLSDKDERLRKYRKQPGVTIEREIATDVLIECNLRRHSQMHKLRPANRDEPLSEWNTNAVRSVYARIGWSHAPQGSRRGGAKPSPTDEKRPRAAAAAAARSGAGADDDLAVPPRISR